MKYLVYFGSSALVIAALLGCAVLVDGEWLLARDLFPPDEQPAAKTCKRGAKGADQISPEALARSL